MSKIDRLDLASSLVAAGRLEKACEVLDLAVAEDAGAAAALWFKGDLLRSHGELARAAETFRALALRQPDHPSAAYLADLLSGSPLPPPARPAPWPAPFVRIEQFLGGAHHDQLMALVTAPSATFEPSTVGVAGPSGREPRVDPASRTSVQLMDIAEVVRWMRPLIEARLPSIAAQLGIEPFQVAGIPIKCTAYGDGCFFTAHSDRLHHPDRRVSFVYYFHRQPKPYTGGALLLYDGSDANPSKYSSDGFTRLDPIDNSVVFFPSGAFHEVSRVVSPSGRFDDARFTLAGHVHTREPGAAPVVAGRPA